MFVTVGNATQGFTRLLEAVDTAAGNGVFGDEKVFMQAGNNPHFQATHCQQEPFVEMQRFEALLKEATLVISHGGAGTLINLLQNGRIPIVMPRQREYSEHVDDHQIELVRALASEGRVIAVYTPEELAPAVLNRKRQETQIVPAGESPMVALVSEAIKEIRNSRS